MWGGGKGTNVMEKGNAMSRGDCGDKEGTKDTDVKRSAAVWGI